MTIRPVRAAAVLLVALFAACASGGKKASTSASGKDAANASVPEAAGQEASLRSRVYESSPDLKSIYFKLDSADFSDAALAIMKANADVIKSQQNTALLIEGHADDRGTIAYNLALGQKRAQAVKEYYLSLEVPLRRMSTISYGELKPICKEEDEACWGQNRRADTKVGTLSPAQ